MRPIERGDVPTDNAGDEVTFAEYGLAKPYLTARVGGFCSYCEMRLDSGLHVEHVKPKSLHDDLRLEWSNFLLACSHCNSIKGDQDVRLSDYIWPDVHNTFRAFEYEEAGRVRVSAALAPDVRQRAERLATLVGLCRRAGSTPPPSAADRRWIKRGEAWGIATDSLADYRSRPTEEMARQVARTAARDGYWSVWMAVFHDVPTVRAEMVALMPGTARGCFDGLGEPLPRPGAEL